LVIDRSAEPVDLAPTATWIVAWLAGANDPCAPDAAQATRRWHPRYL